LVVDSCIWSMAMYSPRLAISMYLLHRLVGQRANPSGSPTEYTSSKQRAEESRNCVLETTRHHANPSEDQAPPDR
jgi:hypothetical protein